MPRTSLPGQRRSVPRVRMDHGGVAGIKKHAERKQSTFARNAWHVGLIRFFPIACRRYENYAAVCSLHEAKLGPVGDRDSSRARVLWHSSPFWAQLFGIFAFTHISANKRMFKHCRNNLR
jgi:hypothetical protein